MKIRDRENVMYPIYELLRNPLLSPLILILRPSSSPLTAFRFFRISSGSCRGVHELLRRFLFAYGVVSSGSVSCIIMYILKRRVYIFRFFLPLSLFWMDWNELRRDPGKDIEKSLFSWYGSTSNCSDWLDPRREFAMYAWSGCKNPSSSRSSV